ncbi:hypothetical protein INP57_25030 [Saccharopolyspora sp. HNM0986]|uniref:hypothetical protein n=1 Tax=Saccharopolyspora galaxeae TaxID=2781241 RepID=UPI00190B573A|nr:hypothetical protein [Saccharopolyspora sp. HNM0986]MBK0870080.1 hypothetical protein [Saccharopolyspora sp. HNM0986]
MAEMRYLRLILVLATGVALTIAIGALVLPGGQASEWVQVGLGGLFVVLMWLKHRLDQKVRDLKSHLQDVVVRCSEGAALPAHPGRDIGRVEVGSRH